MQHCVEKSISTQCHAVSRNASRRIYFMKVTTFEIIRNFKTKLVRISFCQHPTPLPKSTSLGAKQLGKAEEFQDLGDAWVGDSD